MSERDLSKGGCDIYFGSPEDEQPNWRDGDPDDEIDDDDDPAPVPKQLLVDILGFDPDELEEENQEAEAE